MSRGRPPYPDVLTPSETRVLELIRQGKTNSEIANELAISISGVKYHVTNMLGKLGVADRAALAQWRDGSSGKAPGNKGLHLAWPSVPFWTAGTAVAGCVAMSIVGLTFLSRGGGPPEVTSPNIPSGYSMMTAPELESLGMVDAGPILRAKSGDRPVFAGQLRESLSVVLLSGSAEVVEGTGEQLSLQFTNFVPANSRIPNWVALTGTVDRRQIDVQLWAENMALSQETIVVVRDDGTREVLSETEGQAPELLLSVRDSDTGAAYRAAIAQNGHLFVGERAIDESTVLDEWTGAALDVTSAYEAEPLGTVASGLLRFTGCDTDSTRVCYVSVRALDELRAPIEGTLHCVSPHQIEIDAGEFILRIAQVDTGYGSSPEFACAPRTIVAGDVIGPATTHWSYTAVDASGSPISVGVALDGSLYIGSFSPNVGCPCRIGS